MCLLLQKIGFVNVPRTDKTRTLALVPLSGSECKTYPIVDLPTCEGVHAWHTVSAVNGNWLGMVSAPWQNLTFVDSECKQHLNFHPLQVAVGSPVIFGLQFDEDTTLDVTFTLALTQAGANFEKEFGPGRKCIWIGAVAGPLMPDVRSLPYNGATCMWERVDKVGVNFQVDYWEGLY